MSQTTRLFRHVLLFLLPAALLLAACSNRGPAAAPPPAPGATAAAATAVPAQEEAATSTPLPLPTAVSAATAMPTPDDDALPLFTDYSLGQATIIQERFPADSGFREMPIRLEGLLGVPAGGENHPVVLILHGNHPGCPVNEMGVDAWPCDPEEEQANYRGFEYLVRALAARGYVALAPNINGQYTFGFGENPGGERFQQIVNLHLGALAEAGAGGANEFGLPLDGRVDLSRLVWLGHSQGGDLAAVIIRADDLHTAAGAQKAGYGPVRGLLLVAPSLVTEPAAPVADLPLGIILPACDADVSALDGQYFFEAARDDRDRASVATSLFLPGANHNNFNTILRPDQRPLDFSPECAPEFQIDAQAQRDFLVDYTADFLVLALGSGRAAQEAAARLGLTVGERVPEKLYGLTADPLRSGAAAEERLLLRPFSADELATNLDGGATTATGLDPTFCAAGFPDFSAGPPPPACRIQELSMPGNPARLALAWDAPAAALDLDLGAAGTAAYDAVRLRAALDPLAEQNPPGAPLSFTLALTDRAGNTAETLVTLPYPAGEPLSGALEDRDIFSGHVHLREFRLPLAEVSGVDTAALARISLRFDQAQRGALYLADVGLVEAPDYPGSHAALLQNADGFLDPLRGVGRLSGAQECTAVYIDSGGGAGAPAYALTSGHCLAADDPNAVLLDQPATDTAVIFNYFADTREAQARVPAARLAYATSKGRDLALVELGATQGALAFLGVTPLPLADAPLAGEMPVQVVSAPSAPLPEAEQYLRHERCHLAGTADLLEGGRHSYDAYRLDCRDIYDGSAGAPVFGADGDAVVALIATTANNGRWPCARGAPCEITEAGPVLRAAASYATPVDGLGACFDADGRFDLAQPACPLDDGRQLVLTAATAASAPPADPFATPPAEPAAWEVTLSGDRPYYRYKSGPLANTDCRDAGDYGPAIALADQPAIADPLPAEEGLYVLCVLVGETAEPGETWQEPAAAAVLVTAVDRTPPSAAPVLALGLAGDMLLVAPRFDPPELADFYLKAGPPDETDCTAAAGYFPYRRVPLRIPTALLPWTLCLIAQDAAGNAAPPSQQTLQVR